MHMQMTCGIFPIKNEGLKKKGIASMMEYYDLQGGKEGIEHHIFIENYDFQKNEDILHSTIINDHWFQ